jgi:hypothetical protein
MPNLESFPLGYLLKGDEGGDILIKASVRMLGELARGGVIDHSVVDEPMLIRCIRLEEGGRIMHVFRSGTYRVHLAERELDLTCEQDEAWCRLVEFTCLHGMAGELLVCDSGGMVPVRTKLASGEKICAAGPYSSSLVKQRPEPKQDVVNEAVRSAAKTASFANNERRVKLRPKLKNPLDETPASSPRDIDAEWAHWLRHGAQELEAKRVKEMLARRYAALPENAVTKADADRIRDQVKLQGELHYQLDLIRAAVEYLEDRLENAKQLGIRKELTDKSERIIKFIRDDDRGRQTKA